MGTRDLVVARNARDELAKADDHLWSALILADDLVGVRAKHAAAMLRVQAMGFSCVPVAQLAEKASWDEISSRFEAIRQNPNQNNVSVALLGVIDESGDRYSDALQIYIDGSAKIEFAKKSADQNRKWIAILKLAIKVFQGVVSDKPLNDLTRSDALSFCR